MLKLITLGTNFGVAISISTCIIGKYDEKQI